MKSFLFKVIPNILNILNGRCLPSGLDLKPVHML